MSRICVVSYPMEQVSISNTCHAVWHAKKGAGFLGAGFESKLLGVFGHVSEALIQHRGPLCQALAWVGKHTWSLSLRALCLAGETY